MLTEIKMQGINTELWQKHMKQKRRFPVLALSPVYHAPLACQLAPKCNRSHTHICASLVISLVAIAAGVFAYYIFRSSSCTGSSLYTRNYSDFSGTIITQMSDDKCIDLYLHACIYMDLYIHGSEITVSLGKFLCLAEFYSICPTKF